jgi:hypothetical protein
MENPENPEQLKNPFSVEVDLETLDKTLTEIQSQTQDAVESTLQTLETSDDPYHTMPLACYQAIQMLKYAQTFGLNVEEQKNKLRTGISNSKLHQEIKRHGAYHNFFNND